MSLPIAAPAEALGLEVLPEALVEWGPSRAAGILLVAPQVQLALEELIALLAAESGVLCKTKGKEVSGRARYPALDPQGTHCPGASIPPWLLLPSFLPALVLAAQGRRGHRTDQTMLEDLISASWKH